MTEHTPESDWLEDQRNEVEAYLAAEGVRHAGVASEPAWYEPEVVAIWAIRSAARPEATGWWAISGDVPTDYVTAAPGMDARGALAAIASRWIAAAARMAIGEEPDGLAIGARHEWPALAPMLRSRAEVLTAWAADDELWSAA